MNRSVSPLPLFGAAVLAMTALAPADAARVRAIVRAPATAYTYDGVVYDRLFSIFSRPRLARSMAKPQADPRPRPYAAPAYAIVNLDDIAAADIGEPSVLGFPTAVNNAGHITYYAECECVGNTNNIALAINDTGTYSVTLYADSEIEGADNAIPYAIAANDYSAGEDTHYYGPGDGHEEPIAWTPTAGFLYFPGADNGSFALAINDRGVSVGQDTGPKGVFAVAYASTGASGGFTRTLLKPPKNVSWIGTATGINDAGEIVGYGTFPGGGRALRFSQTGYATVLPVGAPGASTSAQAINQRGDVVGNAGNQAYLYRNNRTLVLPRPSGETAGNAVAYAINKNDAVVGDIVTGAHTSTSFLFTGGASYDLNALLPANSGWQITHAAGINDNGQIVGQGYYLGGGPISFSMKPQLAGSSLRR